MKGRAAFVENLVLIPAGLSCSFAPGRAGKVVAGQNLAGSALLCWSQGESLS